MIIQDDHSKTIPWQPHKGIFSVTRSDESSHDKNSPSYKVKGAHDHIIIVTQYSWASHESPAPERVKIARTIFQAAVSTKYLRT